MDNSDERKGPAALAAAVMGLIMLVMIGFAVAVRAQDAPAASSEASATSAGVDRAMVGDWTGRCDDGAFMELKINKSGRFNLRSAGEDIKLATTGRLRDEGSTLTVWFDTWRTYDAESRVPRVVKMTDDAEPASYTWRVVRAGSVESRLDDVNKDRLIVEDEAGETTTFYR